MIEKRHHWPTNYEWPSIEFDVQQAEWLSQNKQAKADLLIAVEDQGNVNPIDDGKPDLVPYELAVKAMKFTIGIAIKKLIQGPYNTGHWLLIQNEFNELKAIDGLFFWRVFSICCASKKEEGICLKERIYMEALCDVLRMEDLNSVQDSSGKIYNVDTGSIEEVKGMGVNAEF